MRDLKDGLWLVVVALIVVFLFSACGTTHTVKGGAKVEVSGKAETVVVIRVETDIAEQINTICKDEVDFDTCAKRITDIYQGLTDAIEAAAKLKEVANDVKPVTGVY
jgi:hypothetical protein